MNTLGVLIGAVSALWLAIWAFNTITNDALGYAMLGLFLFLIGPSLFLAVGEDLSNRRENKE